MMDKSYRDLKKYCYFSCLSDGALEVISKNLHTVNLSAGEHIIREGEPADSFYLVSHGEVQVIKKTKSGQMAEISLIGHGGGFGEMALLTCSPRCCSVTAKTDVVLLMLHKKDFEDIVRFDTTFSNMLEERVKNFKQYNKMKTLKPFALLPPEKMPLLLDKITERKFKSDENIIIEGEQGDEYFIIKSGGVAVLKKNFDNEVEKVAMLYAGDGFGEEALITSSPRNATVRTVMPTTVLALPKSEFDDIIKITFLEEVSAEEVLQQNVKRNYLDVRMPMEFNEEHIPDAINLPLDILRKSYSTLDRDKEYHVYCLIGARSASATFILKSLGYNAKNIKGGILNWPGPTEEGDHSEGVHTSFTPT